MDELLTEFIEQEKIYNLEGETGSKNLEKILNAIGYKADGFAYGSAVERFLQDNPGATQSIIEWIAEQRGCDEWEESITSCLNE